MSKKLTIKQGSEVHSTELAKTIAAVLYASLC